MAITSAISDFIKSIYELFESFFTTLFHLITTIVSAIVNLFTDFFNLIAGTLKGGLNVLGETGKFVFGNAILILVVAAGAVGYLQYQRSQGKPVVVGNKKLN